MQPLYAMPVPPDLHSEELPYYQAFVHAMSRSYGSTLGEKLHHAIAQTAEAMQTSDAHISRILVEHGLRAPRSAFPGTFLAYVDSFRGPPVMSMASPHDLNMMALKDFWRSFHPLLRARSDARVFEAVAA